MFDALLNRIRSFLSTHSLLRPDALILVAVSGGPDSLCLLHCLHSLRAEGGPGLHVAHLDHSFRGAEAAAEAAFVAATAAAWGLPATIARHNVPDLARSQRLSAQAAARAARYSFLAATARAILADAVAVAHQADDQAETVLLHMLRGAGVAGLRGMRAVVAWQEWADQIENGVLPGFSILVRPLLSTSRAEIEQYCVEQRLVPRRDPSNRSMRYARSRLRERLLPALAEENPRVVAALGRTAALCADDYAFISDQLATQWPALVRERGEQLDFDLARWLGLPPTLQRYALRRAARALAGSEELSMAQVEAARLALGLPGPRRHELGLGLWLELSYASFSVRHSADQVAASEGYPQLVSAELRLAVPGAAALGAGWQVVAHANGPPEAGRWWVALDRARLTEPLLLRRRRAGERMRPAGGRGSRRVQDLFVDQKVPQRYRAAWPILAMADQIIWVAGLRAAEGYLADATTEQTLWVGFIQTSKGEADAQ